MQIDQFLMDGAVVVVYLFQQANKTCNNIIMNFYKARKLGQMPIMLAT